MSQSSPCIDEATKAPLAPGHDCRQLTLDGALVLVPMYRTNVENAETLLRLAVYLEGLE